jgi:L-aspartate oxidase
MTKTTKPHFDFIVIGGGIAGLTFARHARAHGTVAVFYKKGLVDTATSWAQGGIASVSSPSDSIALHLTDTLTTGAGLTHRDVAETILREGPELIKELEQSGVHFDMESDDKAAPSEIPTLSSTSGETAPSSYHLHREGGHSKRRILHVSDATGRAIQEALNHSTDKDSKIEKFIDATVIDIITSGRSDVGCQDAPPRVIGIYVLMSDGTVETITASCIVLATGGAGKVYLYTSNPDVATGDGIAMAVRAGARVANMEFFQFHPTCLFHNDAKSFLISEALRGEGAVLKRLDGTPFMHLYHPQGDLAPRDVVARAIDSELKESGDDHVNLDITHRESSFIREHFPTIYAKCLSFGIDITKVPIPVVPAAHFCCGGVVTTIHGESDIRGLYAIGECAHTGLHGANRLASNSLLEGVVMGKRAAIHAATYLAGVKELPLPHPPLWNSGNVTESTERVIVAHDWDEIRRFMWNYVGIVRSDDRLERARRRSDLIEREIHEYYWKFTVTRDLLELRNVSLVARLIIFSALRRKESRGLHYTVDYPDQDARFQNDTLLCSDDVKL